MLEFDVLSKLFECEVVGLEDRWNEAFIGPVRASRNAPTFIKAPVRSSVVPTFTVGALTVPVTSMLLELRTCADEPIS